MDWEHHLEENLIINNEKQYQSQIAACEQETTNQKANVCTNSFLTLLKNKSKKFHTAKSLAFLLHCLFHRD